MTHTTETNLKVRIISEDKSHLCEVETDYGQRFFIKRYLLTEI